MSQDGPEKQLPLPPKSGHQITLPAESRQPSIIGQVEALSTQADQVFNDIDQYLTRPRTDNRHKHHLVAQLPELQHTMKGVIHELAKVLAKISLADDGNGEVGSSSNNDEPLPRPPTPPQERPVSSDEAQLQELTTLLMI